MIVIFNRIELNILYSGSQDKLSIEELTQRDTEDSLSSIEDPSKITLCLSVSSQWISE
jgi:hypothetical protein